MHAQFAEQDKAVVSLDVLTNCVSGCDTVVDGNSGGEAFYQDWPVSSSVKCG